MQLVEPVLHVAEGAQQIQPRFAQVEPGVERIDILLALVDARLLLGRGRKLWRRAGRCRGAVAHFQLRHHALQLLGGNLLLQAGNLGLGIQLAQARSEWRSEYRFAAAPARPQPWRASASAADSLALARTAKIEEGKLDLENRMLKLFGGRFL